MEISPSLVPYPLFPSLCQPPHSHLVDPLSLSHKGHSFCSFPSFSHMVSPYSILVTCCHPQRFDGNSHTRRICTCIILTHTLLVFIPNHHPHASRPPRSAGSAICATASYVIGHLGPLPFATDARPQIRRQRHPACIHLGLSSSSLSPSYLLIPFSSKILARSTLLTAGVIRLSQPSVEAAVRPSTTDNA